MTGSPQCRDIRPSLGVYVLGAIDPAERSRVDMHLSTCPDCREELAGLASLPALLRRVPVAEAQEVAGEGEEDLPGSQPSELMLSSLLNRTQEVRRARRWRGLAAAAAVVLVAGLGGAVGWSALHQSGSGSGAVTPGGAPAAGLTSVSASNPRTRVAATIRLTRKDWGTALDTQVHGVAEGARCQLVVTDTAGHATVVGSWTTGYDESWTWYPGATAVTLDSVRSFAITSHGKVLVTVPMR